LEVIVYRNYIIQLPTLKNHVFPMFVPYSAPIRPSVGLKGLALG